MMLEHFHFLRPLWLLALPLALFAPWAWRRRQQRHDAWRAVCDPHLLEHLRGSATVRAGAGAWLALAWLLAVLALAGPAWREQPQALVEREAALVVAMELSPAMRSTDLAPNRLERARFAIADLLLARGDGQSALLAYAGDAYTVAPVTSDAATLLALLDSLDPSLMPTAGQRASRAIRRGMELLERAGHEGGEILLVASASDSDSAEAARSARASGVRVSVLAVGTLSGAPVPRAEGGFERGEDGDILVPRLDRDGLQEIAAAGGGRYVELVDGQQQALARLLDGGALATGALREGEATRRSYVDEGPWLVLALLPLALLGLRRGALAVVALALLAPVEAPLAFEAASLWQRDDQRAWQALQSGDAATAAELAKDPALRGSALHRAGEHEAAAEAFAAGDDARAHYNRGTALAHAGRYPEALEAFDAALERDPGHADAAANRKAVSDWLEQQKQQPSPGEGEDGESGQPGEDGESSEGSPEEDSQEGEPRDGGDSDPEPGSDPAQGEPGEEDGERGDDPAQDDADPDSATDAAAGEPADDAEQEAFEQAMREAIEQGAEDGEEQAAVAAGETDPEAEREAERRQMLEQWLRRVPDDPGGLLRRKFAVEHQRRVREGQEDPR